jgi:hypothetical protein
VFELVLHARPHSGAFGSLPGGGQRHAQARQIGGALARRAPAVEIADQTLDDDLLLLEQRAAHRFGRMRGQHRFDIQALEPLAEFGERNARGLEAQEDVVQSVRLRRRASALVVAAPADAMHALGNVDDAEIGRECARQAFGHSRLEPRQLIDEFRRPGVLGTQFDCARAQLFDRVEEFAPVLLCKHFADDAPEPIDVLAQRAVVRQEFDIALRFQGVLWADRSGCLLCHGLLRRNKHLQPPKGPLPG